MAQLASGFETPESTLRVLSQLIDQFRHAFHAQTSQAGQLRQEIRQVVEQFISLVAHDDHLRKVFHADDLSVEQVKDFKAKITTIERELGIEWGGDPDKGPTQQANLNLLLLTRGTRI